MTSTTIVIDITAADIRQGAPCLTKQCPVAFALLRLGYSDVMVCPGVRSNLIQLTDGSGEK